MGASDITPTRVNIYPDVPLEGLTGIMFACISPSGPETVLSLRPPSTFAERPFSEKDIADGWVEPALHKKLFDQEKAKLELGADDKVDWVRGFAVDGERKPGTLLRSSCANVISHGGCTGGSKRCTDDEYARIFGLLAPLIEERTHFTLKPD